MNPCPNCLQPDDGGMLAVTGTAIDEGEARVFVECLTCNTRYSEVYELARAEITRRGRSFFLLCPNANDQCGNCPHATPHVKLEDCGEPFERCPACRPHEEE